MDTCYGQNYVEINYLNEYHFNEEDMQITHFSYIYLTTLKSIIADPFEATRLTYLFIFTALVQIIYRLCICLWFYLVVFDK